MSRVFEYKKALVAVTVASLFCAGIVALAGSLGAEIVALAGSLRAVRAAPAGGVGADPRLWVDDRIRLDFVALDDETSLPVKGASVLLVDPFGSESDHGERIATFSDDQGRVASSRNLDLGEVRNDVQVGDQFRVFGWRVKVEAEGYQTRTTPLFEHTGEAIDRRTPTNKHPNIRLHRRNDAKSDSDPEYDMFVFRESFGMRFSLLIYGDKFDALLSCPKLCSQHIRWFEAQHGDLKRVDGVLQLSVRAKELIRRGDDEGEGKWLLNNLVVVKWGRRRYLVASEQFKAFCNAVNLGNEPRNSELGDFALGEGQHVIAVTGRPGVPERWSQYLLKAPVTGKVIELLPNSKAKVNVGRKEGLREGMALVPTENHLFGDMEILSVEEDKSVIGARYPNNTTWNVRVGDIVSTRRPSIEVMIRIDR
jgi:hypothetical protein